MKKASWHELFKGIAYYPHIKNTGFDPSVFEHILCIVSTNCLLGNQRFHTSNCIVFLSHTQQSWISTLHTVTLLILPSNLLLKQNIDHSQYLVWEVFNSQIILLYKYFTTSLGK